MAVLIDSSVWIQGSDPKNKECLELKRLISKNEYICLIKPIQVEVCQGVKTEKLFHDLWEAFLGFEFFEVTDLHWGLSAYNYFKCRKRGITLSTLDCLIGTISKEYQIPLWTLDKNLAKTKNIIGFEVF